MKNMAEENNKIEKSEAALREEKVLEFWRENKIFDKSLEQTKKGKEFVFYEGPPTANGKPGIHHLEARAFKDAIPRYKTMRGYHVRRKGGWDTHGLPVELQVEKKLGLTSKKEIEEYGIAKFNQECKESVWEYVDLWEKFTERIGYWVDQENPYVTYQNEYIESVWNVIKKADEQKLLYKDYKVVPWCPRCGTVLSSHELAQGYEDVKDLSIYAKFRMVGLNSTYFLAWTTTPWTLPGNIALAVGKDIDYVKIKAGNEFYILAKSRLSIIEAAYEVVEEMKGKDLIDLKYEPLFPFLKEQIEKKGESIEKAFKVYSAGFVNTEDGTGIVHTAVMYGQDDFELGTKVGLPKHHLVNPDGTFVKGTGFLEGRFVKEMDDNGKPTLAVDIIEELKKQNLFFNKENYQHSYPHCWRCHTSLIYYARDSWYIRMSDKKIKEKLISENKKINWEPEYTREGRFGEWLREIKDWAISRERYWGTPLPVWLSPDGEKIVVDSLETLKKYSKKSGNKYFVMRHGGSDGNKRGVVSFQTQENDHLTEDGKKRVEKNALSLRKNKIDYIITSNFVRAKETAEMVRKTLGLSEDSVIEDVGLCEVNPGEFDGKSWSDYHAHLVNVGRDWFEKKIEGGESLYDVKKRTAKVLYGLEDKYKDKNILLVTHGGPAWLLFVNAGLYEPDDHEYQPEESSVFVKDFKKFETAEIRALPFVPLPHNNNFDADLHRPFVDEVVLEKDGKKFTRTKEVMDVWLDSGAMPFAQDHYPFDFVQSKLFSRKKLLYPANFISEAIDQTRGWFYTLHAVGILMGHGRAFKNVICLGHLLDAKGKKMSKSVGNVVDPWEMTHKYGADVLRLWMYSVNQPGESKNFDEKTVALLYQQVFGLFYNVLAFYELYRNKELETNDRPKSKNILDKWILARLDELTELTTMSLDNYKLLEPTRAIRDFIGDLSTWYLRRSRERIKEGDEDAKKTLYFVLKTLAKIMAPFAPFSAEDIWSRLHSQSRIHDSPGESGLSVHLCSWPKAGKVNKKIIENMQETRRVVSLGLEARQRAKIQVRQPLSKLEVKDLNLSEEYVELIKDELNVKEIVVGKEFKLITELTSELIAEGEYREFMREMQEKRKKLGLNPKDKMAMSVEDIYKKYRINPALQMHMLRVAAVASMICDNFTEPVDKDKVILASLFHDMGNIIKSNLFLFPQFVEPEGIDYWQNVKDEYMDKYGKDESDASAKIMEEIGIAKDVIKISHQNQFSHLCEHMEGNDIEVKIVHYSDGRVAPLGVVSYQDRMWEARARYEHLNKGREAERERLVECGAEIEKQIFEHCRIKPEDINDVSVAPIIEKLKSFVVK